MEKYWGKSPKMPKDLLPVDRSLVTMRELNYLLQDGSGRVAYQASSEQGERAPMECTLHTAEQSKQDKRFGKRFRFQAFLSETAWR